MTATLLRVPVVQIHPSMNARGRVGDVDELALSLKVLGLMKPLLVLPRAAGGYEILDGHRRHAAAGKAGLTHVDVIVRADPGEAGRLQAQLAMETHSKAFDPMAEARALHTLMFSHNLSREQISRAVGRTPAWVRDRIALVHLRAEEQHRVASGEMSLTAALFLLAQRRAEQVGAPAPKPPGWNSWTSGTGGRSSAEHRAATAESAGLRRVEQERDAARDEVRQAIALAGDYARERDLARAELASALTELDAVRIARDTLDSATNWVVARDSGYDCERCQQGIRRGEAYEVLHGADTYRHIHCPDRTEGAPPA